MLALPFRVLEKCWGSLGKSKRHRLPGLGLRANDQSLTAGSRGAAHCRDGRPDNRRRVKATAERGLPVEAVLLGIEPKAPDSASGSQPGEQDPRIVGRDRRGIRSG